MKNIAIQHSLIFVVDDILPTVYALCLFLEFHKYRVKQFESGAAMLKAIQQQRPNLILLDIMMPDMDGFEVCERLKADNRTKDIPVIFITVKSDQENRLKGFDVGGVDYITKPFDTKEVFARVKAHLTIRKQHLQLEELNASKNKFFSILSHDLRNLLHVPLAAVELLVGHLRTFSPDELEQRLLKVQRSMERLYDLLENLLIWASLQRGAMSYVPKSVNFYELVDDIFSLAQEQAEQKGITLIRSVPEDIMLYADSNMLKTVLRNLTSNALKFSQPGGTVKVAVIAHDHDVDIQVSDTGVGIPRDMLDTLFRIDVQHSRQGTAGERGTGLGLILCKELIGQHGGTIWAESELDQGTTFTFRLKKTKN